MYNAGVRNLVLREGLENIVPEGIQRSWLRWLGYVLCGEQSLAILCHVFPFSLEAEEVTRRSTDVVVAWNQNIYGEPRHGRCLTSSWSESVGFIRRLETGNHGLR